MTASRYQAKDWAGQQAGRLRAMLALSVRMTKRTVAARRYTEHMLGHIYVPIIEAMHQE